MVEDGDIMKQSLLLSKSNLKEIFISKLKLGSYSE